jgi:hypothetical protein
MIVCAAVMVLRVKRPEAPRPFKVAGGPVIPVLGILSCTYLMLSLPVATWVRFLGWLNVGMLIYWFYGRVHSPLVDAREAAARSTLEGVGNFVTVAGALLMFNGFFMAILGFMTVLGMTTEELVKWYEIGVTPEQSDQLGLMILGAGVVTSVIGRLVAKAGRRGNA